MNGYGNGMNAYQAAGELAGITRLVDDFYKGAGIFLSPCAENLRGPSGSLDT
jgi:hypothetical protein